LKVYLVDAMTSLRIDSTLTDANG